MNCTPKVLCITFGVLYNTEMDKYVGGINMCIPLTCNRNMKSVHLPIPDKNTNFASNHRFYGTDYTKKIFTETPARKH